MRSKGKIIFVVVGRLGSSLTRSKVLPIKNLNYFDRIYVFHETYEGPIDGVTFINNKTIKYIRPLWLANILRHILEPIQLFLYGIILRPEVINGYQMIPKGINSFLVGKMVGAKIIISSIGGIPEIQTYLKFKKFWEAVNFFILRNADFVTTKGKVMNDYLIQNGISKTKIMIYNGSVNQERYKYDPQINRDIDILFVGNMSSLKGPERVLLMIHELVKKGLFVNACFVGSGPMFSEVKLLSRSFDLDSNICFVGFVENTIEFYQRSKLFVLPSLSEGLSTAMLEAMASGCVPVVSNVGNTCEAALNEITAKVIDDPYDIDSFVKAIVTLLGNKELLSNYANNGIRLVRAKYSVEAQTSVFNDVLIETQIKERA